MITTFVILTLILTYTVGVFYTKYNKEKNAFVLDFNTIPEKKSVLDTGNYEFMIDNHHLQVLNAQLKGERQVYLFLDETSRSYLGENFESMSSKLKLNVKNVRDVDNRELDRITGSTLFQFRELFVQKLCRIEFYR